MQRMQLDSKEQIVTGFAGASHARNMPERARPMSGIVGDNADGSDAATAPRGWMRSAMRVARNAVIGLLLISAIPLGVIQWSGTRPVRDYSSGVAVQLANIESFRGLEATKDASITPLAGGQALRSLLTRKDNAQFPAAVAVDATARPWKALTLPKGFESLGDRAQDRTMAQRMILQAKNGFTGQQLAYLRVLAEAPMWEQYDRVARAKSIDMIAGLYELPFRADANALEMPLLQYADTRELASAGLLRAAYYVAVNQPERAEAALRSIVSFGFALIDNGMGAMDAMTGRIIVNIGRNGMRQFGEATGQSFAGAVGDMPSGVEMQSANQARKTTSASEMRARWLADIPNANVPRSLRYEELNQLSMSSCRNVSEVLFGESAAVRSAFDNASTTVARFPSDRAYLTLLRNATYNAPHYNLSRWFVDDFVLGAAKIASTVTHNARIETCALVALVK